MKTAEVQLAESAIKERLWSETFGSGWEGLTPWLVQYRYINGNWEKADAFFLKYEVYDSNDDVIGTSTKRLLPQDIFNAWLMLVVKSYSHCFCHIGDLDSFDACAGDMILQQAVFGEVKF